MDLSDSQYGFEDKYDEDDFYDDDVSVDGNNHDSGMEEKVTSQNSYDTESDNESSVSRKTTSKTIPQNKSQKKKTNPTNYQYGKTNTKTPRYNDTYKSYLTSINRRAQSDLRGGGRKPKKAGTSSMSTYSAANKAAPNNNGSAQNAVIKRVLSASRKKTSSLHNVIYELQQQVEELTIANKDLKRSTRVQERDLKKLDGTEAQIPALLKKHSNEITVLTEKWKRQKEMNTSLNENLKKADYELLKTKDSLRECHAIVKQKNLGERIDLQNKIVDLEKILLEKDGKILELNRFINLQKKGQSRIIKDKNEKYAKLNDRVKQLEITQEDLLQKLKNREKALEVTNIYSRKTGKDGKQVVMFSPNDPVAPVLKNYREESLESFEAIEASCKSPEILEPNNKSPIINNNKQVDTMVNRKDYDEQQSKQKNDSPPTTFLTEGRLKRQETEEFYDVNNRKITTKGKKLDDSDASGEDELHEKLDKLILVKKEDSNESVKNNEKDSNLIEEKKLDGKIKKTSLNLNNNDNNNNNNNNNHNNNASTERDRIDSRKDPIFSPYFDKKLKKKDPYESSFGSDNRDAFQKDNSSKGNEEARKKQLLLAKIQAIDKGENPNEIMSVTDLNKGIEKKNKPKKKPIFLQSTRNDSIDKSEEDLFKDKSFDEYSSSDSKANSASSKSRRHRPTLETMSGAETESTGTPKSRNNSREFKNTDENLHRGLPAYPESPSHNLLPKRINDISDNTKQSPLVKPSRNAINYSPTATNIDSSPAKKTPKKSGFDMFDQFDDPFKSLNKSKIEKEDSSLSKKSDTKKSSPWEYGRESTNSPTGLDDDLEEMFIL